MIRTVEALRFNGRKNARARRPTLRPYQVPDLNAVETWLADHEVLDPDAADAVFEAPGSKSLTRRLIGRAREAGGTRKRAIGWVPAL